MKNTMIYHPVAVCDTEDYFHSWENATKKNQEHMNAIEKKAIEQGSLLYRFLYEGVADGVAIYQIVKENKKTVRVRICCLDGLHCDYIIPQWGAEATIPKAYAQQRISGQDTWRKILEQRGAPNV